MLGRESAAGHTQEAKVIARKNREIRQGRMKTAFVDQMREDIRSTPQSAESIRILTETTEDATFNAEFNIPVPTPGFSSMLT